LDRKEKARSVDDISKKFETAKALIFADYKGLKVSEITNLRMKLSKAGSGIKVVKNRLVKKALKNKSIEGLDHIFSGPTAMAYSDSDPAAVAKILIEFAKECEALKVKGGYMNGRPLDINTIHLLATLPSKEVLLSRLLASMNAPATNLAGVLLAVPRALVTVLNAIKEKKASQ